MIRRFIVGVMAATLGLSAIGVSFSGPAAATLDPEWLQCIVVTDARIAHTYRESYQITIKNGCSQEPESSFESIRYSFDAGGPGYVSGSGSTTFPNRWTGKTLDFDISRLTPGRYYPSIKFSTLFSSMFDNQTIKLPSFTVEAPTPDPVAPALPNDVGSTGSGSAGSGSSGSDGSYSGVITCMDPKSSKRKCFKSWTWRYSGCWKDARAARLQQQVNGSWEPLWSGIASRDLNACSAAYPWLVKFSVKESDSGYYKYRIYFPATARFDVSSEVINVYVN